MTTNLVLMLPGSIPPDTEINSQGTFLRSKHRNPRPSPTMNPVPLHLFDDTSDKFFPPSSSITYFLFYWRMGGISKKKEPTGANLKELPQEQSWNNLNNNTATALDYGLKYKRNMQESIQIHGRGFNRSSQGSRQPCATGINSLISTLKVGYT